MTVLHYAVRHRPKGEAEPYTFWYWTDPPGSSGGRFADPTKALAEHDRVHGDRWERHVVAVGWDHVGTALTLLPTGDQP